MAQIVLNEQTFDNLGAAMQYVRQLWHGSKAEAVARQHANAEAKRVRATVAEAEQIIAGGDVDDLASIVGDGEASAFPSDNTEASEDAADD